MWYAQRPSCSSPFRGHCWDMTALSACHMSKKSQHLPRSSRGDQSCQQLGQKNEQPRWAEKETATDAMILCDTEAETKPAREPGVSHVKEEPDVTQRER